jgi:RNA polymerase sigma factor (sigma-70 family)
VSNLKTQKLLTILDSVFATYCLYIYGAFYELLETIYHNLTELELIQGCQRDNAQCQRELFNRLAGKMMTVCLRYARHRGEAEDLLQDGFIKVFDNIKQFEGKGSFEGWVRRIMVNTALKSISKLAFQRENIGTEGMIESSVAPSVLSQLTEQELLGLITQLPSGYRTVFNLFVLEDMSHREIADTLGIEESTSRSQLVKARNMLQSLVLKSERVIL